MKKTLVLALALLLAIFCSTACDSDDDEPSATSISNAAEFASALEKGGEYVLSNNVTLKSTSTAISTSHDLVVDLNGKTLQVDAVLDITGGDVTLKNGTYAFALSSDDSVLNQPYYNAIQVEDYSTLRLDNVIMTSDIGCIFMVDRTKDAELEIYNSEITSKGTFCIGTNATTPTASELKINIKKSKISVESGSGSGDNAALLFNVLGDVTIEDSTITADRQAMIARGGNYTIKGTTFVATGNTTVSTETYFDKVWSTANEVPLAALVVGNRHASSYLYETTMNLENVIISVPATNKSNSSYYGIYIYQNGDSADSTKHTYNGEKYECAVSLTGKAPTYEGGVISDYYINHSDADSSKDNGAKVSFT